MGLYLQEFLINNYYFFMKNIILIGIILFGINAKTIISLFKDVNRKTWFILCLVAIAGFIIRMWFIPHTHHVYFDEFEHINIAENMLYQGKCCVTSKGIDSMCEEYRIQFWFPAHHSILAILFSIFGNSEQVAYNLSATIGSLSIFVIFLMVYLLFNNQVVALYSAFLFSLIPVHLKYSGASEMGVTSLLFMLLTILTSLIYLKSKDIKSLLFLIVIVALTVYTRPENMMLLLLLPYLLLIANKEAFEHRKKYYHIVLSVILLSLLLVFCFLHLYLGLFISPPPGWGDNLVARLNNFKKHVFDNLLFWFSNYHPLSFTVLTVFGVIHLFNKNKKILFFFIVWFLVFLLLYSQYHMGSFLHNSDSDRYTFSLYISLIIFSGYGLFEFINLFKFKRIITAIIVTFIVIEIFSPLRLGLNRTFSRDVYKEYKFILSNKDKIQDDIYVISYNPSAIISSIHKKSILPYSFLEMQELPREAILFKDYWWYNNNNKLDSDKIENKLRERYDFKLLSEEEIQDGVYYSFIKLKTNK